MSEDRHKIIYSGFIKERCHGEYDHAIYLDDYCLAEYLMGDISSHGSFLTVRYWITDEKRSVEEINERFMKTIMGASDVIYQDNYSEYTGYLWTDQDIVVGGHDLLSELKNNLGKYCVLEVEFSKEAK